MKYCIIYYKLSLFLLLAVWLPIGVFAQTNRLYISNLKMSRGDEATLSVCMDNVDEVTAVEFTLEMPSGFSINPVSAILTERAKNHQITARKLKNGKYKFVVMSVTNAHISGIAGQLFTMRVKASETVTDDGDYPMTMSEAVMSTKSGMNVLNEAVGGKLIVLSMPNLHVTSLDCSEPMAGQSLTVKWTVRNDGRGATGNAEWKDYICLTPNISAGTSMTGAMLLHTVNNVSALAPGESYENTVNVTLPERIYGNYDLVVTSNMYGTNSIDFSTAGGEPPVPYQPETEEYGFLFAQGYAAYITVNEENEYDGRSDNFFYKRINIHVPPLADIQVPHVTVVVNNDNPDLSPSPINSAGLASSNAFYSGKKVKVTASIANKGGADVNGTTINNVLYISNTPDMTGTVYRLSSHSMYLKVKAGESVTDEFTATIPYDWYGDTYFIVEADVDDAVYELANTSNNSGISDLVNTLLTPGADFEPYNLNAPNHISSGMSFDVSYSVRNIGPGVPYSNSWTDKVYISSKSTGIDESAIMIGQFTQRGSYVSSSGGYEYEGDSYSATRNVTVSGLQSGTYYLYVKVDADDAILENDGEGNNVTMSQAITLSEPDLMTELLSVSEETLITNNVIAVSWKLKNIGNADIVNTIVKDGFYASSSASGENAVEIANVTNTVSLVAGGEKLLRANITVPANNVLNGTMYFFVKTNIDGKVAESNTSNNSSTAMQKTFVYVSDGGIVNGTNLLVASLQVAEQNSPGEEVAISYTITSNGTQTIDKNVKQEVYFSKSANFDTSVRACSIIGTLPDVSGLKSNESVVANVKVVIPSDMIGGQNYLYVVVNQDKAIEEKRMYDNYAKSPIYVNGNLPNLVVTDLNVPATVTTSEKIEITWTLANTGDWDADDVSCTVHLSKDKSLTHDDRQLTNISVGKLAKGGSENKKVTIELDDDFVGNYYLIVEAKMPDNKEEITLDDNTAFSGFNAGQSPLPDLVFSDLSSEGTWRGGQVVTIKGKVKNVGDDATHRDKWTDVFYLSESYTLDINKAIKLGSKSHVGKLEKTEEYVISTSVNIPANIKGYYVLFAVADGTNTMIEKTKDNNQAKVAVYVEDKDNTPSDLVVQKLSAPSRIMAGAPVTIAYTIANQGEYASQGKLRDVLYMSKDNQWDEKDTMVGVVTGDVMIEPGTEITRTVTGRITNMPEGSYYLIVRTNSTHAIAEADYDNNLLVQRTASNIEFANLSLGGSAIVNTSGLFKLSLHSGLNGKTIGLYLSTPENVSAGIYESFESVPSTARHERSASDIEATEQQVLIPDVQEGTYYILAQDNAAVSRSLNEFVIDGEQEATETVMTLSAREVQFGATTLSITEGGTNGWITTEIRGALLDSIMDFRLARESEMIPAESITFYDQTSSKTTFNLNDAQTGSYDVVSELPNGTQAFLPNGFKVIPGVNVNLGVKIDAPHWVHMDSPVPVTIAYANGGNTDIVIRGLLFSCDGGDVGMTIEDLQKHEHTLSFKPKGMSDNRGFITIPPGTQETIRCYFKQYEIGVCYMKVYVIK